MNYVDEQISKFHVLKSTSKSFFNLKFSFFNDISDVANICTEHKLNTNAGDEC